METAHVVRHIPGESLVYEVKVGTGGVVSPVKVMDSPAQKRVVPKPISPKNMLIKQESPGPVQVTSVSDMKVSLTDVADKRLSDMVYENKNDNEVLNRANDSQEVDELRKENLQLMTIVGQISGQINTLTSSFNKFSTNVEAQLVLMNNRIKAAENNLATMDKSPTKERAY